MKCEFDGCDKPLLRQGLCGAHHAQRRRGWELRPLLVRISLEGPCLAGDCDNVRRALGYCMKHYQRLKKNGSAHPPERRPCGVVWCSRKEGVRTKGTCYMHTPRLRKFNLTVDGINELFASQGGACAICQSDEPGWNEWHIDHDHACCEGYGSCGKCIRGLLCGPCNLMLGHAEDDIEILSSAIAYLRGTVS